MAVGLAVLAASCFVAAAALDPYDSAFWVRLLHLLAIVVGVAAALGALLLRGGKSLEAMISGRLTSLAGPSVIRSMPPRKVLEALLPSIYGGGEGEHSEVLTGMLGGPGRDVDGADTAVSRAATARFRIWTVGDGLCVSEGEWTYELSGVQRNHKFVVFATHDERILALVAAGRRYPLFESFRVQDDDELTDFVRKVQGEIRLGIRYRDDTGRLHHIAPESVPGGQVPLRLFDEYVTLSSNVDRQDLCIVQFDLWDLVHDDHVPQSIEELTVRVRGTSGTDNGWYVWTVPYPCFVDEVSFDIRDHHPPAGRYEYLLVRSTLRNSVPSPSDWAAHDDPIVTRVDSWMLPGHGVTLLWRLAPDPS